MKSVKTRLVAAASRSSLSWPRWVKRVGALTLVVAMAAQSRDAMATPPRRWRTSWPSPRKRKGSPPQRPRGWPRSGGTLTRRL